MTALATLVAEANDAGVKIAVDGNDLLLTAAAQPPAAIVDMLARHKAELIALLGPRPDEWESEDWRAFFDERAGIAEFDGGFSRLEAEARALDCCIAEWLRRNPVRSFSNRCMGCGGLEGTHEVLPLFGTITTGKAWLHSLCWPAWSAARRSSAIVALQASGLSIGTSEGAPPFSLAPSLTQKNTAARGVSSYE